MHVFLVSLFPIVAITASVLSVAALTRARAALRVLKADAAAATKLMGREVSGWRDLAFAHADLAEEWRALGNSDRATGHEDEARTCGRVADTLQDTLEKL